MHEVVPSPIFHGAWPQRPQPEDANRSRSRLWLPRPSLSSCVFAMFSRDTRGLEPADLHGDSYFPSVPACCLVWGLDGEALSCQGGRTGGFDGAVMEPMPKLAMVGPRSRALWVRSVGPSRFFVLMLLPDAFHALTGVEPGEHINRITSASEVLDEGWQAVADAVQCAADDEERVRLVQNFLAPRWAEKRPPASFQGRLLQDWSHALSLRAATSGFGRSLRQVERRIKRWTGQPLRDLKGMVRLETALLDTVLAIQQGDINWAELAVDSGFSDQAHLCRQVRLMTGFSPQELIRRVMSEEAFWFYRLWSGVPQVVAPPDQGALEPSLAHELDSALVSNRI